MKKKRASSSNKSIPKLSELTVFFPCFNEQENIPHFVAEAMEVLPNIAKKFEILIINDGSIDSTRRVAKKLAEQHKQVRLISHKVNRGYGASLRTGFRKATYQWVFFTDGDLQFKLHQLQSFIPHAKNFDAIIGYRKKRADGFSRHRNAMLYKLYVDLLFRLHVRDIDCAFKLFRKNVIDQISLESSGAFISSEILYKLKKKKVKFKQIPVNHYPRKFGDPTGANWRVIVKAGLESLKLYLHMKLGLFREVGK